MRQKIAPALKRQITSDWHQLFPQMGIYRPMWLARRIGPLIQGICLDRRSGNDLYIPTTHLHCLCWSFPAVSLSLQQVLLSKRTSSEEAIDARFHGQYYQDAARRLVDASLVPLAGDLTLDQALNAYHGYRRLGRAGSKYPVPLFEDAVHLVAWCGDIDRAQSLLGNYVREMRQWPSSVMALDGGVDAWEIKMIDRARKPDRFREVVQAQARELEVMDLPVAKFHCS